MKALIWAILLEVQLASVLGTRTSPFMTYQHKCWVLDTSCLRLKVQAVMPIVAKGNLALGIEQLDPMLLDALEIDTEILQFSMRNLQVKGLKDAVIDNISIDMISRVVQLVYHADLLVKSQYLSKGLMFGLPIAGEGDITITLADVQFEMNMPFDIIKDDYGRDVMNLKGLRYSYNVRGGAQYELSNLFYGDMIASDRMHNVLNKNWKYCTAKYGGYLFDLMNPKIFTAVRNYILSQALCDLIEMSSGF